MTSDQAAIALLCAYALVGAAVVLWQAFRCPAGPLVWWLYALERLASGLLWHVRGWDANRRPRRCPFPTDSAALIVANHRSPADPVILRFALGVHLPTPAQRTDRSGPAHRSLGSPHRTGRRVGRDRPGALHRRRHLPPGEKRGDCVGVGRKGNGTTALVLMDGDRTPLGVVIAPANDHEVGHIERLLDAAVVEPPRMCRLIYDGAADSDPLRERLAARGVELIRPHRADQVKPPTQDGRKLRLRRHRWGIERTNAWLHNYGRIVIRKDRLSSIFLGWTQLACLFTILKMF